MQSHLTFVKVSLAGLAIWLGVQFVGSSNEAWDNVIFFTVGLPLMLITTAVAGYVQPVRWWLWGIAIVSLQIVALFWLSGFGPLSVVGLAVFLLIAALCTLSALAGKSYRASRK